MGYILLMCVVGTQPTFLTWLVLMYDISISPGPGLVPLETEQGAIESIGTVPKDSAEYGYKLNEQSRTMFQAWPRSNIPKPRC